MNCIWILLLLCCCNKGNCNDGGHRSCEDNNDYAGRCCAERSERIFDGPGPEIQPRRPLPPFSPDCGCDLPEV